MRLGWALGAITITVIVGVGFGFWALVGHGVTEKQDEVLHLSRTSDAAAEQLIQEWNSRSVTELAGAGSGPLKCSFLGKLRGGDHFSCRYAEQLGADDVEYVVTYGTEVGRISFGGEQSSPPGNAETAALYLEDSWNRTFSALGNGEKVAFFTCQSVDSANAYSCFTSTESGAASEINVEYNTNGTIASEEVIPVESTTPSYGTGRYSPQCDPANTSYNPGMCDGPYDPVGP